MKSILKDKRGGLYLAMLFALLFFMFGIWMLPFLQDSVTHARTSIQCTNSSITDGGKMTCLFVDAGVPYFIILVLILIGGIVGNEL